MKSLILRSYVVQCLCHFIFLDVGKKAQIHFVCHRVRGGYFKLAQVQSRVKHPRCSPAPVRMDCFAMKTRFLLQIVKNDVFDHQIDLFISNVYF